MVAAMLVLGGSDGTAADETALPQAKAPAAVVAHQIGPARVEPGAQLLPARPCARFGREGTTTVRILSDTGECARVKPGERLRFVNDTGIGPRHKGARTVRVRIGDYSLRIEPGGSGLVPAPVESYLGRGAHRVRTAGGRGATILLLPPGCAIRAPVDPGAEPCFR